MKYTKLAALCAVLALGTVACSKDASPSGTETTPTGAETTPSDEPNPTENVVTVVDNAFEPADVSVAVGDTVIWSWSDTTAPHNVVSSDGTVDSGEATADPDHEFTFTFDTAGTYDYMCEIHGADMSGTITVA